MDKPQKSQDDRFIEIEIYVKEGLYAATVSNEEKRGLRKSAKNFTVIGKSFNVAIVSINIIIYNSKSSRIL